MFDCSVVLIQQLNDHLELFKNRIQSLHHSSNLACSVIVKTRIDLIQNYTQHHVDFHRILSSLFANLCNLKDNQKYFQINTKHHNKSIEFFAREYLFSKQKYHSNELDEFIRLRIELDHDLDEYQQEINRLKQEINEQHDRIGFLSNNLLEIQSEQKLIEFKMIQIRQTIEFECRMFDEMKNEYLLSNFSIPQQQKQFSFDREKFCREFFKQIPIILGKNNQKQIDECKKQQILLLQFYNEQKELRERESILKNQLELLQNSNQNQKKIFENEFNDFSQKIKQNQFKIEQQSIDLLSLRFELHVYRTILLTTQNVEQLDHTSAFVMMQENNDYQKQLPTNDVFFFDDNEFVKLSDRKANMPKSQTTTTIPSRSHTMNGSGSGGGVTTSANSDQSLGPNLQSRLEALEAAMGVRLNVAKRQGRHSLSTTTSTSPMQVSPTSTTSSSTTAAVATLSTSLSSSSRQNLPARPGQGVQRSASSCDVENRPGPIKRLKPSLPAEQSSSSTAVAIATMKKYPPPVRRPLNTATSTPVRSSQPKQSTPHQTPIKQRSSPMDTSSPRSSRSSTTSNSTNSSNYRTPIGNSPKISQIPSPKTTILTPRPPPIPRKQRLSIFGEQFSDDILKTNLLWIEMNELDDEGLAEVHVQFGSLENFLYEQQLFILKQQQQSKIAAKTKTVINRSRLQLLLPKKDRLELL